MLFDKANVKYNLGPRQFSKKNRQDFTRELKRRFDSELLLNESISELPLYELKTPGCDETSFIFLNNHTEESNILYIPDQVFQILEKCSGISFEYHPCTNISESVKSNFKCIIDKSIAIIELTYHLILKYSNSNNFDIYLSLVTNMLDHYCSLLSSYSKIMKVKDSLGKNLDYIILSSKNLAFGTIDPQGCLLCNESEFNYKNISFKPVVNSNNSIKVNDKESIIINNLSKLKPINKNTKKNYKNDFNQESLLELQSDTIRKWALKIMSNQNHLFIIDINNFHGETGLMNILEKEGYKLKQINL